MGARAALWTGAKGGTVDPRRPWLRQLCSGAQRAGARKWEGASSREDGAALPLPERRVWLGRPALPLPGRRVCLGPCERAIGRDDDELCSEGAHVVTAHVGCGRHERWARRLERPVADRAGDAEHEVVAVVHLG